MIRLIQKLGITTLILSFAGCAQHGSRRISSDDTTEAPPVPYRGLDGINVDNWTAGFFGAPTTDRAFEGRIKDIIITAVTENSDANTLFEKLVTVNKVNKNYPTYSAYKSLADGLVAARKAIRKRTDIQNVKQVSALLQFLLEETLYVAAVKFPNQFTDQNPYYRMEFPYSDTTLCQSKDKLRLAKLMNIPICSGDVVLNKGGAGSSSFLARFADYPANFSHAFITHVAADTKKVTLLEALIDDGAKLRDAAINYEGRKDVRKLWFYRYNQSDRRRVLGQVIDATDQAVANFNEKAGGDAFKNAAFPYDFLMDADGPGRNDRLFCSEIPIYVYSELAKLDDNANPYAHKYWSTVSGATRDFFKAFLSIPGASVPAPGDIEQNPAFDIVGLILAPRSLAVDRVDIALIDVMISRLNSGSPKLKAFFDQIGRLGDHNLTPQDVSWMQTQTWLPAEAKAKIAGTQVPPGISAKQLAFFSVLNEVVTPQVRAGAETYQKNLWQREKRPAGPLELRVAVEKIAAAVLDQLEQQIHNAL